MRVQLLKEENQTFFFFNVDKNIYFILAELLEILDVFWLRSIQWFSSG